MVKERKTENKQINAHAHQSYLELLMDERAYSGHDHYRHQYHLPQTARKNKLRNNKRFDLHF